MRNLDHCVVCGTHIIQKPKGRRRILCYNPDCKRFRDNYRDRQRRAFFKGLQDEQRIMDSMGDWLLQAVLFWSGDGMLRRHFQR